MTSRVKIKVIVIKVVVGEIKDMEDSKIVKEEKIEQETTVQIQSEQVILIQKMEKQLFFTRLIAIFTGLSCIALIIVALVVIPPVMKTLRGAQEVMNTANATMTAATTAIETAEKSLENVETMTDSIIVTSNQLNDLVSGNAESMTKAMTELSNIDFEGLNGAITDLQDAVGPFANLMRKFQ